MALLTGRVFITIGGNRLSSKKGAKLDYSSVKREMVLADHGVAGPKEETVAPGVECTLIHGADTSLAQIQAITASSGSFDTDSGKSYILTGLCCLDALSLADGEVKVKFGAVNCKEV